MLYWLKKAARRAVAAAAGGGGSETEVWDTVRGATYPPSDQNEYRHLRVADYSDAVSALPQEELQVSFKPQKSP